jgi:hypothetical protein
MSDSAPYLSIVVTARNDDHGGNLLGRMQVFVNALIGQCRRHDLDAELVLVEWHPPPERESLLRALSWPQPMGPCRVRLIQVPPQIHRRYKLAETLPLYQMIAKNAGIRRARGQFVLATNIDIVFSDELMRFLAARRLERRRMYRIDRYDVASDVPVDASLDEQLAWCRGHLIRLNAREGSFPLTAEGLRGPFPEDIASPGAGLHFGSSWYPAHRDSQDRLCRWAGNDAELIVRVPADANRRLSLDLEPGPSAGGWPLTLQLVDAAGTALGEAIVRRRMVVSFALPWPAGERRALRLRALGGGLAVPNDPHILNFRVFRCAWASRPAEPSPPPQRPPEPLTRASSRVGAFFRSLSESLHERDIASAPDGLQLGAGWHAPESFGGESFRWVENDAELIVRTPAGPPQLLVTRVQPGPAVGFGPSTLEVRDHAGQIVASAAV